MQILSFREEVTGFLKSQGIEFACEGNRISFPSKPLDLILVPLGQQCQKKNAAGNGNTVEGDCTGNGKECVYLYEDRWRYARSVTSQRLLSRLGKFRRIHARLCKVVSVENCREHGLSPEAFNSKVRKFLDTYHTYGYLKGQIGYLLLYKNDIVAAAQFKQTYQPHKTVRSLKIEGDLAENPGKNCQVPPQKEGPGRKYEWTRYACLPDVRIAGGMGKVLEQFVRDVRSKHSKEDSARARVEENRKIAELESRQSAEFEVMSYSDNEWSDGDAYRKLGFELMGSMPPVTYRINPKTFNRINPRQWAALKCLEEYPVIRNLGSRKWIKIFSGF